MKSKVFLILLFSQIALIVILLCSIYKKITGRSVTLSPIDKKFIEIKQGKTLEFFYEPRPNATEIVKRNWLSYSPTYHINNDSLNERYEYEEKKDEGVFRIITLGDSFTFGAYVDTKANWPELLEDYLNKKHTCPTVTKYEVINLGMDGYDTAYEVERYIRRGKKYNPDLIVMLVTDFGRVTEHRLSRKRMMPTMTAQQKEEYWKKGNFYPEMNIYDGELTHEDRVAYQAISFKRLMAHYANPLLVVDFSLNDSYKNDIRTIAGKYKSVTLSSLTLKRNDKRYILTDWHPSSEGHKKIMEEMVSLLNKNVLLPCNQ
ncbi:MAG: SGNH/GDSL hydrolase family protein [Microgenomates group bacterium]